MLLSLDLINLLKWFTELRETCYLLCQQFIIKGYNLETARWKRYVVQVGGKGPGRACYSPLIMCSPTGKLSEPYSLGFLWRFNYTDTLTIGVIDHWLLN